MKKFKKYIYPVSVLLLIVVLLCITFISLSSKNSSPQNASQEQEVAEQFTYQGRKDVDAYTLLEERADIKEESSGLIVSINDREADNTKNEFWSFYINGEQAEVGPKEYITKDTDTITWKIENY